MANPTAQFNRCMWFANLAGWPNGASEAATERCFDRAFGRTDNMRTGGGIGTGTLKRGCTDYAEKDGSYYRSTDALVGPAKATQGQRIAVFIALAVGLYLISKHT
jgi:hypothetical protein